MLQKESLNLGSFLKMINDTLQSFGKKLLTPYLIGMFSPAL